MDTRNDKGESLVHQAVKKGDIARVKQLIDDGHTVNTIDHNSWTPFHEVRTGHGSVDWFTAAWKEECHRKIGGCFRNLGRWKGAGLTRLFS